MTTEKKTYSAEEVIGTPTIGQFLDLLRESEEIDTETTIAKKDWAARLGMTAQEYNYYLNEGATMSNDKVVKIAETADLDDNVLLVANIRHSLHKVGKTDVDVYLTPKLVASAES